MAGSVACPPSETDRRRSPTTCSPLAPRRPEHFVDARSVGRFHGLDRGSVHLAPGYGRGEPLTSC